MLKPEAQGDAPEGDDAPDAAATDAPKVRLGGGNTDATGFLRNLSLDLQFSTQLLSTPWRLLDIQPFGRSQGSASGARGQGIGREGIQGDQG